MSSPLLSTLTVNGAQAITDSPGRSLKKVAPGEEFGKVFQRQDAQKPRVSEKPATSEQDFKNESPREFLHETPKENINGYAENNSPNIDGEAGTQNSETQMPDSTESIIEDVRTAVYDGQNFGDANAELELTQVESFSFWVHYVQMQGLTPNNDSSELMSSKTPMEKMIGEELTAEIMPESLAPISTAGLDVISPVVIAEKLSRGEMFLASTKTDLLNSANKESGSSKLAIQVPNAADALLDTSDLASVISPFNAAQSSIAVNKSLIADQPIAIFADKTLGEVLPLPNAQDAAAPMGGSQESKWLGQAEHLSALSSPSSLENKSFFQLRFNQQTLAQDLVEKTGWLIEHKLDTAQIQLDPPELGPITVKIHTHQDQVSVTFVVNSPQVRDAMDQTLQRLKDLLQDQGIMLSHADVNGQRQQRDNPQQEELSEVHLMDTDDEDNLTLVLPEIAEGVDHFV